MIRVAFDIGGTFTDFVLHDDASGATHALKVPTTLREPRALAESILNPQGNGEKLQSKETRGIKKGDVMSFRLSGAGGYGPPEKRDPAAVAEDIADGYVTREAARRDYGLQKLPPQG